MKQSYFNRSKIKCLSLIDLKWNGLSLIELKWNNLGLIDLQIKRS